MSDRHPNILFLFTDDQRFDTLRALGNEAIETPHLDRLVETGTAFTQAHIMGGSCAAVCMPSRGMLHTGRGLFELDGCGQQVPEDHALLGETFRRAGYETFGIGKWHNGARAYARSFTGGAEIFFGGMGDHWNVPACRFDPEGQYPPTRFCPNPVQSDVVRRRRCDHITPGRHSSELFADAAVRFLGERAADRPFLLYLSFMAPHDPRTMPEQYLARYPVDGIELPPNAWPEHPFDNGELDVRDEQLAASPRDPAEVRRHLAAYYAMITHADAQVGRVLDALEATGETERTIVVFAADNGLAVGRHGLMGKQNLYDHSVRVPLVLAGPGVPQGERRESLCYLHDLFPTLCDLADLPVPESVSAQSLAPALAAGSPGRDALYFAYRDRQRGLCEGRFKLIEYAVRGARCTQLFDLEADPWEMRNLAGLEEQAPTVRRLRERLEGLREEHGDRREQEAAFWRTYREQPR